MQNSQNNLSVSSSNYKDNLLKGEPIDTTPSITAEELRSIIKANKHFVFNVSGLNRYRADLFKFIQNAPKSEQEKEIEKAKKDFSELKAFWIENDLGERVKIFLKAKPTPLSKDEDEEEENEEDDNLESTEEDDNLESTEEDDNIENEDEDNNEAELTDFELQILQIVQENLSNNNTEDDNDEEIAEKTEPPSTSDEVKEALQSLSDKGFITFDIEGDTYNVTSLTNSGKDYLDKFGSQNTDDNEDENEEFNSESDDSEDDGEGTYKNQESSEEAQNNEEEDNSGGEGLEEDEENTDLDDSSQEQNQEDENQDGSSDGDDGDNNNPQSQPMDAETAKSHAAATSTEELQKFIQKPGADPNLVSIAKLELESRQNKGEGGDVDNQEEENQLNPPQNNEEENEFKEWMNKYLDDHDDGDLRAFTKKLILQSPAKRKELKQHYKTDFSAKNGGNRLDKVDEKEFDEWLDEYLSHLPFGDLKDYASKMLSQNPREFKNLKSQFKDLKENNMLN